jgi:hypothetical protein
MLVKTIHTISTLLFLAILVNLAGSIAHADSIQPGQGLSLSGTTLAARPELAGTVIQDVFRPFSFIDARGLTTGEVQDRVVRENLTGTLDFYTRVILDPTAKGVGDNIIRSNFTGFTTDVDYRTDSIGTLHPLEAVDFLNGSIGVLDGSVGFSFLSTVLTAGTDSVFFFIKTNAANYDANGTIQVSGESGDAFIQGFEPATVPEPASLVLEGSALLMLCVLMRHKRGALKRPVTRRYTTEVKL